MLSATLNSSNGAYFVRLMTSIRCHIDDDNDKLLLEPDMMFEKFGNRTV